MTGERKFTDEELIEWHKQKLNDKEIGEVLGVTGSSIHRRRTKLGLKNNYVQGKMNRIRIEKLKKMWRKGFSYPEIAKELGVSVYTIWLHRKKLNLPKRRGTKETIADWQHKQLIKREERCYKLRQQGLSDEEIEIETGYPPKKVPIYIGKAIMRRCRKTPKCPYKALLPENEIVEKK